MLLSAVGIFSVLAYLVGQRTREIAIRRAVGAGPAGVVRLVLGQGLRLVALGLIVGVVSALLGSRLLAGLVYKTSPWDFITYASAVGVLAVAATGDVASGSPSGDYRSAASAAAGLSRERPDSAISSLEPRNDSGMPGRSAIWFRPLRVKKPGGTIGLSNETE